MNAFRPINNNVLVRPDPWEHGRPSGLVVPEPHERRTQGVPRTGRVLKVGPGQLLTEGPNEGDRFQGDLRPGDHVVFLNFRGMERYARPEKYGEELLILDADDILAVLDD